MEGSAKFENMMALMAAVFRGDSEDQMKSLKERIVREENRKQCASCQDWTANPQIAPSGAVVCLFCLETAMRTAVRPAE